MLIFPQGMGTGLFSVIRGIAGTLGVTLSSTFLEHQRTTHAIYLAQQQGGTVAALEALHTTSQRRPPLAVPGQ